MNVTGREVGVVAGRWRERLLDERTDSQYGRHSPAKGSLFALVALYPGDEGLGELLDPSAVALADELRRRLATAYYEDPGRSVTASLGRALEAMNGALYAANEANPPEVRRYAAVTCTVAREGEVFIALAGPAVAHIATGTSVETLNAPEDSLASALVGSASEVSVELAHRTLDGPAAIILATSSLDDTLPDGQVDSLLSFRAGEKALEALRQGLEGGSAADVSAVFVEVVAPDPWLDWGADGETVAIPWPAERAGARQPKGVGASAVAATPPPSRRPARRARRTAAPRLPLILAAAVVAAVLFYAFPVRLFLDYQGAQAQQSLVEQAQAKEQEAQAENDPANRLKLLVEAGSLASRAARDGRGDPATADLDKRIQSELDAQTATVRLSEPTQLTPLDGQPAQLALGAADLFVLDRGGDRVLRYPLEASRLGVESTGSPVVLKKGDKLGELEIGGPRQILWMLGGSGRAEGFLILDAAGTLFEWDPSGSGLKISRPSQGAAHLPLLAGYAGTLYTLDTADDLLEWRPPSSGTYDLAAYPYFQPDVSASVSDVTSFAVADDLYALRKSGEIDRFVLGKPSTFAGVPLDRPLGPGSSLTATARGVYVFDPTNYRIVQFARDGTYLRQFALEGVDSPVDIALDEGRGLIYVLGQKGIYLYRSSDLATMPPTPTPAATPATPALTPAATPAQTPLVTPATTPGRTPSATPAATRTGTPLAVTRTPKR